MADKVAKRIPGSELIKSIKLKVRESTMKSAELVGATHSTGILQESKVVQNVFPELELIDFYKGYRAPTSEYSPQFSVNCRVQMEIQSQHRRQMKLPDVLNMVQNGHLTVVGPAGSGKTTMLKTIAHNVATGQVKQLEDVEMVHFLQGRDLYSNKPISPMELLLHKVNLDQEEVEAYLKFIRENPSKVLFIIDSLDTLQYSLETTDKQIGIDERSDPKAILWSILTGNIFKGSKLITSSREHTIRKYEGKLRAKNVVALVGLTSASIQKIVEGSFTDEVQEIMDYLNKSPALMNLCSIPVFLSYFLVAFEMESRFEPRTITGILVLVLQNLMRSEHARDKDVWDVIHKLKALAFQGTKENRVLFKTDELAKYDLKEDEVTDLTILAPGGKLDLIEVESSLFFNHQSLQELLTAYHVAEMEVAPFKEFVEKQIHDPRYAVVRRILCGIMLDQEIETAASTFFQGSLDLEKREILRESLKLQLTNNEEADFLELLLSFNEAGDALKDIVSTSLINVDLRRMTFSPGDYHAVCSVMSRCTQLQSLYMPYCNLDSTLLRILNTTLKESNVQIETIDIRENKHMGREGLQNFGELVDRCGVKKLFMSYCNLKPDELAAFSDAMRSSKLKIKHLTLRGNTSMGEGGLAAVGNILRRSEIDYVAVERCELKATEMDALGKSLDGAKIKRLNLGTHDTYGKVKSRLPIANICSILPNISLELNLTGWELEASDLTTLKNKLKELDLQDLKIICGTDMNEVILARDRTEEDNETGESAPIKMDEADIEMGKYGTAIADATIKPASGGAICLHGCAVEFLPHSVESESSITIRVSNESSTVPEEYQVISPTLTLDVNNVNMAEGGNVFGEITTWCFADNAIKVDLLRRTDETQGWVKYNTFSLGEQRTLRFEIKRVETSEWLFAILPTSEATRALKYRIHAYLYRGDPSDFSSYYCIDDDFALSRVKQYVKNKSFTSARPRPDSFVVKIADAVSYDMTCADECPECTFTIGGGRFEFSGVFKSKCFTPFKYQLGQVSMSHKERSLQLVLTIRKNDKIVKEMTLEAECLSTKAAGYDQSGEGHPDRPALQDTYIQREKEIVSAMQSLRQDIEENIRTARKTRAHIGTVGGTMKLCGCKLIFPPDAFEVTTPVEMVVGSQGAMPDGDHVLFTPILTCILFGVQPKKPVAAEMPVYSFVDNDDGFVVLCHKRHRNDWIQIEGAVVDTMSQTVRFNADHFCGFAGFFRNIMVNARNYLYSSKLYHLLYYNYKKGAFIALTYIGGEKNADDCTKAFKQPEIECLTHLPLVIPTKRGDKMKVKLSCGVPLEPFEWSIPDSDHLLEKKYEFEHFVLKNQHIPRECQRYVKYLIEINEETREVKTLPSPLTSQHTPRQRNNNQAYCTDDIDEFDLKLAQRDDYEKHLGDDNAYQISRQRAKGKVLILNNYFANNPNLERVGSEVDIHNMTTLWEAIGLSVTPGTNMSAEQMRSKVRFFAESIGEVSICVVIVMSHGKEKEGKDAIVCEDNEVVLVDEILRQFDDDVCVHLKGVPKLFFMQCCRGERFMGSSRLDVTEAGGIHEPAERTGSPNCDRLVAYATPRTFVSFRNEEKGGWFINAITNVFMNNAHNMSVSDMMNLVNKAVFDKGGRQMSTYDSTLLGVLMLFPGMPESPPPSQA